MSTGAFFWLIVFCFLPPFFCYFSLLLWNHFRVPKMTSFWYFSALCFISSSISASAEAGFNGAFIIWIISWLKKFFFLFSRLWIEWFVPALFLVFANSPASIETTITFCLDERFNKQSFICCRQSITFDFNLLLVDFLFDFRKIILVKYLQKTLAGMISGNLWEISRQKLSGSAILAPSLIRSMNFNFLLHNNIL